MSRLILFNKPFHCLSQFRESDGRTTLARFFDAPDLRLAGRLDYDSEGLLLLSDDGQLVHRITSPGFKLPKTYWAQVEGAPNQAATQKLCTGVVLNDGPAVALEAAAIPPPDGLWPRDPPVRERATIADHWLAITITEGRNRQVRRMTAAVGLPTLRLIRARVGDWALAQLQPGEHREISVHAPAPVRPGRGQRQRRGKRR